MDIIAKYYFGMVDKKNESPAKQWKGDLSMNQKKFEDLELRDDFMFGKVMRNKEICKKMLEILLGIEIEEIEYPETQKTITMTYQGKNVCLDVYVADNARTVYNAEMQQSSNGKGYLPNRSRYYQGMIDSDLIERGVPYTELKKSYIIFICTFDPFGKGYYQYSFQNVCQEDKQIVLGDGATRIFFNTKGNLLAAPEELRQLLQYIETKQIEQTKEKGNLFLKKLDKEVTLTKQNEEWRREYMKELLHDYDVKEEGRREGAQLSIQIIKCHLKGIANEEIASALKTECSYVDSIIAEYEAQ